MIRIGILALQGAIAEHASHLLMARPDVRPVEVRHPDDLNDLDGIILPGGESTVMGKLLLINRLFVPLLSRINNGLPVWGTCAGLILLAKEIIGEAPHLATMDIRVRRNAFGRQLDSFIQPDPIPAMGIGSMNLIFIRAPWIEVAGPEVEILHQVNGHIVAARQNNMFVTSFHPELTGRPDVHRFFLEEMVIGHAYFASVGHCDKMKA